MRATRPRLLALLALTAGAAAAAAQREEVVALAPGRPVAVAVPPGFTAARPAGGSGAPVLRLEHSGGEASLELVFLPDPEGRAATPRGRRERMVELFEEYVAASVEQAMRFEELEPRRGAGTWCRFTDRALAGRAQLPANEFRQLTVGVKAWPGVLVAFRLFSQDSAGPAHQAAWRVLRDSVDERPVPLR